MINNCVFHLRTANSEQRAALAARSLPLAAFLSLHLPMPNPYFRFKQFTIHHDRCAMKVTTDACLFGAWCSRLILEMPEKKNLLDIGTGTGLLSLMIVQQNKFFVDAIEIEAGAAEQARENVAASPWPDAIRVWDADIVSWKTDQTYDVIVSNPPFYENELQSEKANKNIAHHSHALTLSQLVDTIRKRLDPDGRFFLLLPYKRLSEAKRLMEEKGLHVHINTTVSQSVDHDPFRVLLMGGHKPPEKFITSHLDIWDENKNYTKTFMQLLRPYYLYL
jgi:tRNA1Val (adenine37-N6)-methyltransferase